MPVHGMAAFWDGALSVLSVGGAISSFGGLSASRSVLRPCLLRPEICVPFFFVPSFQPSCKTHHTVAHLIFISNWKNTLYTLLRSGAHPWGLPTYGRYRTGSPNFHIFTPREVSQVARRPSVEPQDVFTSLDSSIQRSIRPRHVLTSNTESACIRVEPQIG